MTCTTKFLSWRGRDFRISIIGEICGEDDGLVPVAGNNLIRASDNASGVITCDLAEELPVSGLSLQ